VVVNTCSVRQTAEDRLWGRLGLLKSAKRRHPFRLVLMGCMAERLKEEIFAEAPQVDVLVGSFQKHRLSDLLEEEQSGPQPASAGGGPGVGGRLALTEEGEYRFATRHSLNELRVFVPVMHGCDNFCTYCIVPYVRGREVSRGPDSILEEIHSLVPPRGNARDITLLGQNVNSYRFREPVSPGAPARGDSAGTVGSADQSAALDFPALLRALLPELPRDTWLRFLTSHPKDMSEELIALVASEPALCRHIHLPVQHGSDRVLQAMGRGYTSGRYLRLVEAIRKTVPGVSLTTDILVGFPRESAEDHRRTLALMRAVEFEDAFMYRYNPREGTRAFLLGDDVPDLVKQERLSEVIELQRGITRGRRRRRLGAVTTVLVEGVSRKSPEELLARTEWDDTVVFPGDPKSIGSFVRVCLEKIAGNTFRGRELTP
jgi:tRNA-2-methylthio-N6-dimethylallyladenosine synthase